MATTVKKPFRKQSVGALYYDFATEDVLGALTHAGAIVKSEVIKTIETTENSESANVWASGKVYDSSTQKGSDEIAVEVIAIDATDLAKMRGDAVEINGLAFSGNGDRPYFAFGKTVLLTGGHKRFEWFPKCKLTSNSDAAETSEGAPTEQNENITIQAMPFNDAGDTRVYYDTTMTGADPKVTEELFFSKVIMVPADLVIPA